MSAGTAWRVARVAGGAVFLPVVSLALGFLVAGVAVFASGASPVDAYVALFQGAFTNHDAFSETLLATVPYIFLGLALALGFRAGLFNIGADGQFYLGAVFAVAAGTNLGGLPGFLQLPVSLLAGVVGGMLWGAVPGILKARFGAHEVIVTIMMNYVAYALTSWLVNGGPLVDPRHPNIPRTAPIDPGAMIPILWSGTRLHWGLVLALLCVPAVWFLIERTTVGFRIRTVGMNPDAARAAGISVPLTLALTMGMSGALAGLAGGDEILGLQHYLPSSFSIGYGFDAIAVALLARSNPWAIIPSAFLFGAMRNGAGFMQLQTQVSSDLISIIQATVIMFVAAPLLVRWLFRLRAAPAGTGQITTTVVEAAKTG